MAAPRNGGRREQAAPAPAPPAEEPAPEAEAPAAEEVTAAAAADDVAAAPEYEVQSQGEVAVESDAPATEEGSNQ
jgi:hypothetical protein